MSLIEHYHTGEFTAEIETWLDQWMPPLEVINAFCVLLDNGFLVKTNTPTLQNTTNGTIVATKNYLKVHWNGSNKQMHVSILVDDGTYVRAKEGPGIEKFGRLTDINMFIAEPPPNRNPKYLYGESQGIEFIPRIVISSRGRPDAVAGVLDTYTTAKVKFICRIHSGLILTDIEDPSAKNLWFAIEASGHVKSGVILYNHSKWLPATKEADRVYKDTNLKLTIGDKELFDAAIKSFVAAVYGRSK